MLRRARCSRQLGVCFDTCHAFAAGYEFRDRRSYRETFRDLDARVGLDRVLVFHLNDSKGALGSRLDRHAHIGRGEIGLEAFRLILNDPRLMDVLLKDVFDTLQIYLGSLYVNDFNAFGRTYQVVALADSEFRMQPDDITELKTRNAKGGMVPIGSLVNVKAITGPDKITRYNMYPAAEINGSTLPGVSSGQAIEMMDKLLNAELPPGFGFEWTELSLQQVLAGNVWMLVFPLSVIFVFLALAAQYES